MFMYLRWICCGGGVACYVEGQTYLLEGLFFRSSSRAAGDFQPAATGEFFVELRSIKVSHVLLCLWLVFCHLTCFM